MSRFVAAYLTYHVCLEIEEGQEDMIEDMAFEEFSADTHPEMTFRGWEYTDGEDE